MVVGVDLAAEFVRGRQWKGIGGGGWRRGSVDQIVEVGCCV